MDSITLGRHASEEMSFSIKPYPPPPIPTWILLLALAAAGAIVIYAATRK